MSKVISFLLCILYYIVRYVYNYSNTCNSHQYYSYNKQILKCIYTDSQEEDCNSLASQLMPFKFIVVTINIVSRNSDQFGPISALSAKQIASLYKPETRPVISPTTLITNFDFRVSRSRRFSNYRTPHALCQLRVFVLFT